MAKNKQVNYRLLLIALLVLVPIIIMWTMGFGNYNADEFRILSIALLADIALIVGYTLLSKIQRNP